MIVWTITKFKCRDYSDRKLLVVHFVLKQKHNGNAMVQKILYGESNIFKEPWNLPQTTSKQMQDISLSCI